MPVTRMLTIVGDGPDIPVQVTIADPTMCAEEQFSCAYSIDWPQKAWNGEAYGFDGVQALLTAMNFVAAHLYTSDYHHRHLLFWDSHEEGYGFPLGKCLQDRAVGADKEL